MKKIFTLLLVGVLTVGTLAGCTKKVEQNMDPAPTPEEKVVLKIGATPPIHTEILEQVKPVLAEQNIDLQILEFNDYVQPNTALADGDIDANFFQHQPYLDDFCKERSLDLVSVGKVHVEPLGLYSKKITDFAQIADGATIALPNDNTNLARALLLLQGNGLIKLKDGVSIMATEKDIAENTKNIKFELVEAATLPRVLEDVDAAVINTNFAMAGGLNPIKDALIIEGEESPYANIIATRADNKDSDAIKKLVEALNTEGIKTFINTKYEGAIVPAF